MCKELSCLPQAGGLLDQDADLMRGVMMVLENTAKKQEKDRDRATRH